MKYKSYGNNNKEFSSGNDLELLTISDKVSARSLNRPSANLYENQEDIYKLLNTLLKTTYGNIEKAIIPDLYEEFAPDGFFINSFKGSTNYFLRIPTGSMLLTTNKSNTDKDKLVYGEEGYIDTNSDYNYSRLGKDYTFTNKPNINLLERQLASLIDLDLDDTYNDIKIESVELPVVYIIYKVSEQNNLPDVEDFNLKVLRKDNKVLYLCEESKAQYYCDKDEISEDIRTLTRYGYKSSTFKKYFYKDDNIKVNEKTESITGENYKYFTTKIEDAIFALDENNRAKKCIGYSLKVTRNLTYGKKDYYFPNERKKAYIDLYLSNESEAGLNSYKLTIKNKLDIFNFVADKSAEENIEDLYFSLMNKINYSNNDIYASIVSNDKGNKGIRISFGIKYLNDYDECIVSLRKGFEFGDICYDINSFSLDNKKVIKSERQYYYRNIFELVNGFLFEFKPYLISSIDDLLNYLSGEILLPLLYEKGIKPNKYYIYYDIESDKHKVISNPKYDKSGRIFIDTNPNLSNKDFIKLFCIGITWDNNGVKIPKVNGIEYFVPRLDKRLIATKRGEFQTLISKLKTDIIGDTFLKSTNTKNSIKISDNDINIIGTGINIKYDTDSNIILNKSSMSSNANKIINKAITSIENTTGTITNKATTSIENATGTITNKATTSIENVAGTGNSLVINGISNKIDITSPTVNITGSIIANGATTLNNGITILGETSVPDPKNLESIANKKYVDTNKEASDNSLKAHSDLTKDVHGATSEPTKNKIVIRDETGSFKAKEITAESFIGNAKTASNWNSDRTLNITGDAVGTNTSDNGNFDVILTVNHSNESNITKMGSASEEGSGERNIWLNGPVDGKYDSVTGYVGPTSTVKFTFDSSNNTLRIGKAKITVDNSGNIKFSW